MVNAFPLSPLVKQGDPLSPSFFLLAMEKLSHMILARVDNGIWKPVKAARRISHLFFADDLMALCEGFPWSVVCYSFLHWIIFWIWWLVRLNPSFFFSYFRDPICKQILIHLNSFPKTSTLPETMTMPITLESVPTDELRKKRPRPHPLPGGT